MWVRDQLSWLLHLPACHSSRSRFPGHRCPVGQMAVSELSPSLLPAISDGRNPRVMASTTCPLTGHDRNSFALCRNRKQVPDGQSTHRVKRMRGISTKAIGAVVVLSGVASIAIPTPNARPTLCRRRRPYLCPQDYRKPADTARAVRDVDRDQLTDESGHSVATRWARRQPIQCIPAEQRQTLRRNSIGSQIIHATTLRRLPPRPTDAAQESDTSAVPTRISRVMGTPAPTLDVLNELHVCGDCRDHRPDNQNPDRNRDGRGDQRHRVEFRFHELLLRQRRGYIPGSTT